MKKINNAPVVHQLAIPGLDSYVPERYKQEIKKLQRRSRQDSRRITRVETFCHNFERRLSALENESDFFRSYFRWIEDGESID